MTAKRRKYSTIYASYIIIYILGLGHNQGNRFCLHTNVGVPLISSLSTFGRVGRGGLGVRWFETLFVCVSSSMSQFISVLGDFHACPRQHDSI